MRFNLRKLTLLVSTCSLLLAADLGASDLLAGEARPEIDALFSEYAGVDVPGCALGVIQDGAWAYQRGYGMTNLEYDIPITADSIFRMASVSKQFTAAAIALLAESGEISLDDSLARYFPELPAWAAEVTIYQLIYHTSGIRDYLELAFLAGKGSDADYFTNEWVMELLTRQRETNFTPGSRYLYSNSGYLLLAFLVKRVTGQSLREYSAEHIFTPLGMSHSHFQDNHAEIVKNRASGYAPTDDGFQISMTTLDMVGDGGVFTSINDLLAWDQNFYQNRLGKADPQLITLLTTPATLNDGSSITYAFGLDVDDYRGQKMVSHTGSFVGFRSGIFRFPELRFSVMVLCNRADSDPEVLAKGVTDLLLADVLEPRVEDPSPPDHAMSEEELQRFVGDFWEAEEAFAAETQMIDGALWAIHSPTRKNLLRPVGPARFQMMGVPALVLIDFEITGNQISSMRRSINGKPRGVFMPFERLQLDSKELAAYSGEFYSPELDVSYILTVDDNKLWFDLDDEGPQELTAMFDETFENPDYGAFLFERDGTGKVTGFNVQLGRVRNLVFLRQP